MPNHLQNNTFQLTLNPDKSTWDVFSQKSHPALLRNVRMSLHYRISANPIMEEIPLGLHANVVDVDIEEILTTNIDWGDGFTETLSAQGGPITYTVNISHTYQQGSMQYTITTTVVDLALTFDQITTTVTVQENFQYVYLPFVANKK